MTNTGMARQGLGNDEPPTILECLKRFYGTQRLQELDQYLLLLQDPMDWNQPLQLMLRTTEDFQMFLMAHLDG